MGNEAERTVTLRTGETLEIETLRPPVSDSRDWAALYWWADLREDAMSGCLAEWLETLIYVGSLNGRFAGSICCHIPAKQGTVGLVEFVGTNEDCRGKGIATAILATLVDDFVSQGGQALYLCTANPIAGRLYEGAGFWYHTGDGMRFLSGTGQNFDDAYRVEGTKLEIRRAHWGDLPRVSALYNHPEPQWIVKDYPSKCFAGTRYERHFIPAFRATESGDGEFLVLETDGGRIVGAACFRRSQTYHEQHVGILDFRVAPSATAKTGPLLRRAVDRSRELEIGILSCYAADSDESKIQALESSRFALEGRCRDRISSDGGSRDLLRFELCLDGAVLPAKPIEGYYGEIKNWQRERIGAAARDTDGSHRSSSPKR